MSPRGFLSSCFHWKTWALVASAGAVLTCTGREPAAPTVDGPQLAIIQGQNLLLNPDFEAGGQNWVNSTLTGRTVTTTNSHSPTHSEQITASSKNARETFQGVTILGGSVYDAQAWLKTSGLAGPGASVVIRWLDAGGAIVGNTPIGALRTTANWTLRQSQVTAPMTAVAAQFALAVAIEPDNSGKAWFDDALLVLNAPPQPDSIPPTVSITAPSAGTTVAGSVMVQADAADDLGIAGVRFQVDGVDVGSEITTAPYALLLDVSSLTNGSHDLVAIARDGAGNTASAAPVNVTVVQLVNLAQNPGFESGTSPWRNIGSSGRTIVTTPVHGGTKSLQQLVHAAYPRRVYQDIPVPLSGAYDVSGWLRTTSVGGVGAQIVLTWLNGSGLADPAPAGAVLREDFLPTMSGTQAWALRSTQASSPAGAVVMRLGLNVARDPDGSGTAWFDDLVVRPPAAPTADTEVPVVVLTSPSAGGPVSGLVTLSATASDNTGVVGVRFQIDGVDVGPEDTATPFALGYDSASLPDGDHIITAIARDFTGNTATSPDVVVSFQNSGRPNIVLVLADDMRHDLMSYLPLTSALLAGEAVVFDQAFTTTPDCCPSRSSLLSGQYSHNTGVLQNYGNNGGAPRFNPSSTVATWLQGAGYRTGIYGKYLNAYASIAPAVPPGWSEFHVFVGNDDDEYYNYTLNHNGVTTAYGASAAEYSTTSVGQMAEQFISSTPSTRPLFLMYTPFGPHNPATPEPTDIGTAASIPDFRPPSYDEADISDKPSWLQGHPQLTPADMAADDAFHRQQIETLASVDRSTAAIIATLQQTGRWNNTLFVFSSDNGLLWGEHRLRNRKSAVYEESVRIPMWVRVPGGVPRVDSSLVALIDLAPTFAAWGGTSPSSPVNGLNMLPLVGTPGASWRTELLLEEIGTPNPAINWQAVRTAQYLYAEYENGEVELYDMVNDPWQMNGLAGDPAYSTILASLHASLAVLKNQ